MCPLYLRRQNKFTTGKIFTGFVQKQYALLREINITIQILVQSIVPAFFIF